MKLAEILEQELEKSTQCKNKEELAKLLEVNYKTLCGWFNRNAFSLEVLFSISRLLDIDLQELRLNMPLTNKEVLQLYNKKFERTPYVLEGYYVVEDSKQGQPKKLYTISLEKLELNTEMKFSENIQTIPLKDEYIKELLDGYEVTVEFDADVSFSFYIKTHGDYLVRRMLESYTMIHDSQGNFKESYITENEIDVFFEKIRLGYYDYYGEVITNVGNQNIEKWVEITPLDESSYSNRILYLK